jgi:hypothetical protein
VSYANGWSKALANEKPVFVAIMIGMNDRHSMQACEPSGKSDSAKASTLAFRSKEWAEAYGKEVDEIALVRLYRYRKSHI